MGGAHQLPLAACAHAHGADEPLDPAPFLCLHKHVGLCKHAMSARLCCQHVPSTQTSSAASLSKLRPRYSSVSKQRKRCLHMYEPWKFSPVPCRSVNNTAVKTLMPSWAQKPSSAETSQNLAQQALGDTGFGYMDP